MNTPAHMILGAAAFARPAHFKLVLAGVLGGFAPDVSLYVMTAVSLLILDIPAQVVFNELYFSDAWQAVFSVDNSFFFWGIALALTYRWKHQVLCVFCSAALLHLALDFPLHHDDGRPHFWPATTWVYESPLSYWDMRHGAAWIAPLEALIATAGAVTLWVRKPGLWVSMLILALLVIEYRTVRGWFFFIA